MEGKATRSAAPEPKRPALEACPCRQVRSLAVLEKLGLPTHNTGLHAFRNGLGTALANAGASPAVVQQMLRHTDIKTTLRFYGKRTARQPKHDSREALPMSAPAMGDHHTSALEQRTGHLFRNEVHLLAPHFQCHGRIVLNTRTDAYDKGLLPHPAHHSFGVESFFLNTAHYGVIADSAKRRAVRGTPRANRWKLFGNVGHQLNRDTQFVNRHSLARELANTVPVLMDIRSYGQGPTENATSGRFINPRTFCLPAANTRKHR